MIRKIFVAAIGMMQVIIGVSSIFFIYIFYSHMFNFQIISTLPIEQTSFYLLLFLVVSFFSLISGLLFIQEWRSLA